MILSTNYCLKNESIDVHEKCYIACVNKYAAERVAIEVAEKLDNSRSSQADVMENCIMHPGPLTPSQPVVPEFNNNKCFICGFKKNVPTRLVTKPSIKHRVMQFVAIRDDPRSLAIKSRIQDVDLVKVQARYHRSCLLNCFRKNLESIQPVGRPRKYVDDIMEYIYSYLKLHADSCQFTMKLLADQIPAKCRPCNRTIKKRLLEKYDDKVVIHNFRNSCVLCFKNTEQNMQTESRYPSRSDDKRAEKIRGAREVGAILREEIRFKLYPMQEYLKKTGFMKGSEEDVPELLATLLEEIIVQNETENCISAWKKKLTTIAHTIIKAARPRCFLSKVLHGVGHYLNIDVESKLRIDTLSAIGLSYSSSEVDLHLSSVSEKHLEVLANEFAEWTAFQDVHWPSRSTRDNNDNEKDSDAESTENSSTEEDRSESPDHQPLKQRLRKRD